MNNPPLNSLPKNVLINKELLPKKALQKKIHELFHKKYSKMPLSYNKNITENIIYNEKSHIVATFKDHLIIDDIGEFLKRYYTKKEIDERLKKYYEYYDLYSKVFPNYTIFIEGKYLYQNIQKKQKMIDLQEKMELEQLKKNKEKDDLSSLYSDSKESVLNTDVIDSILNGTNTEGIKNLFDIKDNDIDEEENVEKDINNIIDEINKYGPKEKKIVNNNHNMIKNKIIKINNFNNNIIQNNSINKYKNEVNNENIRIKNISIPINLNYTKNKILPYSNMNSTINNVNVTYYRDMSSIISKFFNYPTYQRNIFLNLNGKNINSINKIKAKSNEKNLVEKLEQNLFKMKQKSIFYNKSSFQNISTTNQTQKDISLSKMNSNIYSKKPSTSTSLNHNQKIVRKNINQSNFYKIQNNSIVQNIEKGNKGISPLTSRNPKNNRHGNNMGRVQSAKYIKGNTYHHHHISETISRNKYANNLKLHNKSKSTIMNSSHYTQIVKYKESQNKQTKYIQKRVLNNTKDKYQRAISKIDNLKQKKYIKNQNSRNRNDIKRKILYNDNNNSRNYNIKFFSKNLSQTKTFANKRKTEFNNDFSMKSGMMEKSNVKRNFVIGFNIKNFSKVLNISNINPRDTFYKSHRNLLIANK